MRSVVTLRNWRARCLCVRGAGRHSSQHPATNASCSRFPGCGSRMAKIWPFFGLAIVSRCNAWFPVVIRGLIGRFAVLLGPAHERYEHAPGPVKAI